MTLLVLITSLIAVTYFNMLFNNLSQSAKRKNQTFSQIWKAKILIYIGTIMIQIVDQIMK